MDINIAVGTAFRSKASLIHREALYHLCDMASKAPPGTAVEIGVYRGSSLLALSLVREGMGTVIGVDDWSYPDPPDLLSHTKHTLEMGGGKAELMSMTSAEAAKIIYGPLAFVHIDGNHTLDYVRQDIELWTPKVMPGGIIAFHDYGRNRADIQVKQAVDEWQERDQWLFLGEVLTTIGYRKP